MGTDVTIRAATAGDEAAVTEIHARCIGDVFAGRYVPPAEERAERQRSWAGPTGAFHPRHALLVAEQAGRVVGFAAVGPARDADVDSATTGVLRIVAVEARERGLGIGSTLIAGAERAMRDSGFLVATLWVLPDNAQAVRCYERCGWRADDSERRQPDARRLNPALLDAPSRPHPWAERERVAPRNLAGQRRRRSPLRSYHDWARFHLHVRRVPGRARVFLRLLRHGA